MMYLQAQEHQRLPAHPWKVDWPHIPEGTNPADTLFWDFQLLELWENSILLVSSQLVVCYDSNPRDLLQQGLTNPLI